MVGYIRTHEFYVYVRCAVLSRFSHVWLYSKLWTVACQAPLSNGILQARTLEWVAMPSSSFWHRDRAQVSYVSCIGRWVLYRQSHLHSPICIYMGSYTHIICLMSAERPRSNDTPVVMSTPNTQALILNTTLAKKQGSMEKWVTPGLGKAIYKAALNMF